MDVSFLLKDDLLHLIIPFGVMLLFYFIFQFFRFHKWRIVHLVAQWSSPIFVLGVIYLVHKMYDVFILSYILIAFILFLAIYITNQWRKEIEISLRKGIILLLRVVFLLFFISYITLVIIYIIRIFA